METQQPLFPELPPAGPLEPEPEALPDELYDDDKRERDDFLDEDRDL